MLITVQTFAGHILNDSDYHTTLLNPHGSTQAEAVYLHEPNADAVDTGAFAVDTQIKVLSIAILNSATRETLLRQLKTWFKRGTRGNLIVRFGDDGLDYQLDCRASGLVQQDNYPNQFLVTLKSAVTAWRAVTADTDTWYLTGAGGTRTITVAGDDVTTLNATFTPTTQAPDGYLKQQLYQVVPPNAIELGNRPWCLELNTQALVSAGKMLSSCHDLRIWLDDKETRRWISGPNTTSTKIWFNLYFPEGQSILLRTAIASSGDIDWLDVQIDNARIKVMRRMPDRGYVYHGSEWFAYDFVDRNNSRLRIVKRGAFNTTEQAHNIGDTFSLLPAAIRIVYHNSGATDPALSDDEYDNTKPLFNLSSSDNTKWVWGASDKFYDPTHPSRLGGWQPGNANADSRNYWFKHDAESGDAVMGMKIMAQKVGSTWLSPNANISWSIYDAGGMKKITVTGEKYRNSDQWPDTIRGLRRRSENDLTTYTIFDEATPGSTSTWTALTNNSVANTIAANFLTALFSRSFASIADAYAMLEIQTCTIEWTTANIPAGTLLGEQLNYTLNVTLGNNQTGDFIHLLYAMRMNKDFIVNAESNAITYDGSNAHNALSLNNEGRSAWIPLEVGSNQLEIVGDDVGALGISLSWYRRRL